jgi:hypothetical protein
MKNKVTWLLLAGALAAVLTPTTGCGNSTSAATTGTGGEYGGHGGGAPGPGQFGCGSTACDLASEYCFEDLGDGATGASFRCLALPTSCPTPATCACLPTTGCVNAPCSGDATKGMMLECSGGP